MNTVTFLRTVFEPRPPGDGLVPKETIDLAEGVLIRGWQEASGVIPQTLTPRQLRLWLVSQGISIESVETHLSTETARIEWEYASVVQRNHPLVDELAQALGMTAAQVDAAFLEASKL